MSTSIDHDTDDGLPWHQFFLREIALWSPERQADYRRRTDIKVATGWNRPAAGLLAYQDIIRENTTR